MAVLQKLKVELKPWKSGEIFAAYIADEIHPNIIYDPRLDTPELRARFLAHELCHVYLHPPCSIGSQNQYVVDEETVVYEAAARICGKYGVDDYTKFMRSRNIPIGEPRETQQTLIRQIVSDVLDGLMDPTKALLWTGYKGGS